MQPVKNRPGRPSFQPTEKHRKLARLLASRGIPQDEIASFMSGSSQTGSPETVGISPETLRKHLRRELTLGGIEANVTVLKALHKMACSGKRNTLPPPSFGPNAVADSTRPVQPPRPFIPHRPTYIFIDGKNPVLWPPEIKVLDKR